MSQFTHREVRVRPADCSAELSAANLWHFLFALQFDGDAVSDWPISVRRGLFWKQEQQDTDSDLTVHGKIILRQAWKMFLQRIETGNFTPCIGTVPKKKEK